MQDHPSTTVRAGRHRAPARPGKHRAPRRASRLGQAIAVLALLTGAAR